MKAVCAGLAVGRGPRSAIAWLSPWSRAASKLGSVALASPIAAGQSAARSDTRGTTPSANTATSTAAQRGEGPVGCRHQPRLADSGVENRLGVVGDRGAGEVAETMAPRCERHRAHFWWHVDERHPHGDRPVGVERPVTLVLVPGRVAA